MLPIGTVITPNGLYSGLWALPRPLTSHWGSGELLSRIEQVWGKCEVIFGKQDQVYGLTVDLQHKVSPSIVANWEKLPFKSESFASGYWDPPYLGYIGKDGDVHYSRLQPSFFEICRVISERIFIFSPLIYPCPSGFRREAVIAITMGPNKIIRCLQCFARLHTPNNRMHLTAFGAGTVSEIPLQSSLFADDLPATIGGR